MLRSWKLVALTIAFCCVPIAGAQVMYTIPQTVTQTLAPAGTACTGSPQTFGINNIGQTQHSLIAVASSTTTFEMYLQGKDQNGNYVIISDTAQSAGYSAPIILNASGYFPVIQAVVDCNGTSSSFALTYSGTSGQPVPDSGNYLTTQVDKLVFFNVSAAATTPGFPIITPFGNSAGMLSFYFNSGSGSTGAQLQVTCQSAQGGSLDTIFYYTLANNNNTQQFQVPDGACPQIIVRYVPGSGSSGSVGDVEYAFVNPASPPMATAASLTSATNDAAQIAEKGARWSVVSTPAVSTQASASKPAGGTGVYHVADCISWSGGATTAPAATALTINLRNGATGAGTIIWSATIVVPASTGENIEPKSVCGLNLIGSANTAMTLEFSGALTNELQGVTLTGYDVQ